MHRELQENATSEPPNPRGSSLLQESWRGLWNKSREAEKGDEIKMRGGTRAHGCLSRSHGIAHDGRELETCQVSNCKGLKTIVQP